MFEGDKGSPFLPGPLGNRESGQPGHSNTRSGSAKPKKGKNQKKAPGASWTMRSSWRLPFRVKKSKEETGHVPSGKPSEITLAGNWVHRGTGQLVLGMLPVPHQHGHSRLRQV